MVAVFALAFALALAVVFAAVSAVSFSVASAVALVFAFAFALVYVIHFHWICFSELIHDPLLVRVQVGMDDRPQLVVVTLKLLRVHQQMVSQFLWGLTQHHTDFHVIIQLCRRKIFVDIHLLFPRLPTSPQTLLDCHSSLAVARLAAS